MVVKPTQGKGTTWPTRLRPWRPVQSSLPRAIRACEQAHQPCTLITTLHPEPPAQPLRSQTLPRGLAQAHGFLGSWSSPLKRERRWGEPKIAPVHDKPHLPDSGQNNRHTLTQFLWLRISEMGVTVPLTAGLT